MSEEKPKLPLVDGLERLRKLREELRNRQPSDALVQIVDDVTKENYPDLNDDADIAAQPLLDEDRR